MADLVSIKEAMKSGRVPEVKAQVQEALDAGVKALDILNKSLLVGMDEIGIKFKANEIFVAEVMIAARAMKEATKMLKPLLVVSDTHGLGKIAMGTVRGDLHDIGKNLVVMMLECAGFEVVDLGTDVKPEQFINAVKDGAKVIGMSALLTTTMMVMKEVVDEFKQAGLRDQVKIMVGGAPISAQFAEQIGADSYSADAAAAVDTAKRLVS
ncbi:MAG: cobalamin B12-binding domain-containing protein [Christensenellales bacterium]